MRDFETIYLPLGDDDLIHYITMVAGHWLLTNKSNNKN